jgi:hypothetical protein
MRPWVGCQELGQQIEAGRLAGSVRADERMRCAAFDPQRLTFAHCHETREFLSQILGFEDYFTDHYATPLLPNVTANVSAVQNKGRAVAQLTTFCAGLPMAGR